MPRADYFRRTNQDIEEWFWDQVEQIKTGECLEWTATLLDSGYGVFMYDHKMWKAHRYAWTITNGPIPKGLCVLHKCDNPPCVNPDHLYIGTQQDNSNDKYRRGRAVHRRGVDRPEAKLTEEAVKYIRQQNKKYQKGFTHRELGLKFGVSDGTVYNVIHRKTWRHVI